MTETEFFEFVQKGRYLPMYMATEVTHPKLKVRFLLTDKAIIQLRKGKPWWKTRVRKLVKELGL